MLAYLFHTMGELCLSPVGLSMVTKLAPLRLASLMMGVWFLINFVANWLAGIIGSFAESLGELTIFGGLAGRCSRSPSCSGCSPDSWCAGRTARKTSNNTPDIGGNDMAGTLARRARIAGAVAAACALLPPAIAGAETADEFVARLNKQFAELGLEFNAAGWTQATYINVGHRAARRPRPPSTTSRHSAVRSRTAKKFEGQTDEPRRRSARSNC